MPQHLVRNRLIVSDLAGDGEAFRHGSGAGHRLIRVGGFLERCLDIRGHLPIRHRADSDLWRDRQRAVSGRRSVGLEKKGHNVRTYCLAQPPAIGWWHGGLNVPDQIGSCALPPGIHEIPAGELRGFVTAGKVGKMAARAVRLILGEALGRLANCVNSPTLAVSGQSHDNGGCDYDEEALFRQEHFSRHSIQFCDVEPDVFWLRTTELAS
jgi:hypothetical protein